MLEITYLLIIIFAVIAVIAVSVYFYIDFNKNKDSNISDLGKSPSPSPLLTQLPSLSGSTVSAPPPPPSGSTGSAPPPPPSGSTGSVLPPPPPSGSTGSTPPPPQSILPPPPPPPLSLPPDVKLCNHTGLPLRTRNEATRREKLALSDCDSERKFQRAEGKGRLPEFCPELYLRFCEVVPIEPPDNTVVGGCTPRELATRHEKDNLQWCDAQQTLRNPIPDYCPAIWDKFCPKPLY